MLVVAAILGSLGMTAPIGAAGTVPPADPPQNIAPQLNPGMFCTTLDDVSASCVNAYLHNINYARSLEGLPSMVLPSDFSSLSVDDQDLVVTNLERGDRGLFQFLARSNALDTSSAPALATNSDPSPPGGGYTLTSFGSNFASDQTALGADYGWMYDDGFGGANGDCTAADVSGCWGHRNNILGPWQTTGGQTAEFGDANDAPGPNARYTQSFANETGTPDTLTTPSYSTIASTIPATVAPDVLQVLPSSSATTTAGTVVTIEGNYFSRFGTPSVTFGGVPATNVTVNWDGELTAQAPADPLGTAKDTVPVVVTTTGGGGSSVTPTNGVNEFTYAPTNAPTITSVTPNSSPITGDNTSTITINGTNLCGLTCNPIIIDFGKTEWSTGSFSAGSSQITLTGVPSALTAGTVDITVTTDSGTSATSSNDHFTYTAITGPAVTSVSPNTGPSTGGTSVTIGGTNFNGVGSVTFGGVEAQDFSVNNAGTSISATAPANIATGAVDVVVTGEGGTSATSSADHFTYTPPIPTVTGVSPSSGATGSNVTISGTGFVNGATVKFNGTSATIVGSITPTSITATVPTGSGTEDVVVTTSAGASATNPADQFTYNNNPVITGVVPSAGSTLGGTTVVISGFNLAGPTSVLFGAALGSVNSSTPTSINVTSPGHAAGMVDIVVTTGSGTSTTTANDQFTYEPVPTVTGLTVSQGPLSGGTALTIEGTGFGADATVKFGATSVTPSAITATTITVVAPAGSGTEDVTVKTAGGTSPTSGADQFTYDPVPTVTALNVARGPAAGGTSVTVTGTGFISGSTAVAFGTNAGVITGSVTPTSLTVTSPSGGAGLTVDVKVTTPGGTSSASGADQFTYDPIPSVSTVSPSGGPVAGGTSVTVTGTGFISGNTTVKFGGTTAASVSAVTSTSLTATSPAESLGTVDVTIVTPGGTSASSSADHFTYEGGPTVTGLSPSVGPQTGGTPVTISGTNLAGATSVMFGSTNEAILANTPTTVQVDAPAGTGTVNVVVTTSVGTSTLSSADQFTYIPPPTVTSISPNSGPTAGGTAVTLTGTNLSAASGVSFGGVAASIAANTPTSITVTSPVAGAGAVDVVVTTTGGASATSNADVFTYVAPPPPPPPPAHGYWLVGSDGGIFSFGSANFWGSTGSLKLQRPVVGITPTAGLLGYWLVASDGGVFAFGNSQYVGSIPGLGLHPAGSGLPHSLNAPIVGMVPSVTQGGYFMVASDGGVFAFGDAQFEGSCPQIGGCAGAAVGVAPDASGHGYWLITATGHLYTFGDAPNFGAPGPQSSAITSIVRTHDGGGYWILDADGDVFAFGDAPALGKLPPNQAGGLDPANAVFATSDGGGYWVTTALGKVYAFGDAPNDGDVSNTKLNGSIIAATGF